MSVTLFYASDVHGAERLWRKFINAGPFYGVNILVMGGDVAGKAVMPLERVNGGYLAPRIAGDRLIEESELEATESRIRDMGFYPYRVDHDELEALQSDPESVSNLFRRVMVESFERWIALAEDRLRGSGIRLYVMLGNDDEPTLRDVLASSSIAVDAEDEVVDIGEDYEMVSCGWSNPTPWASPREMPEDELERYLEGLIVKMRDPGRGVFNFHVPPYGTQLDQAPVLDGTLKPVVKGGTMLIESVGSKAVRRVIERYQPTLALHGHIHESRGTARIGKTICINPGSVYSEGMLHGVLVEFDRKKKLRYQLTSG
jgi:Icc-related predicted phosphoesterase